MSIRPRSMIGYMAVALASFGMAFAAAPNQRMDVAAAGIETTQTRRAAQKRMHKSRSSNPLPIRKHRDAARPAKHTSRVKSSKRRRSKVRMRSHH